MRVLQNGSVQSTYSNGSGVAPCRIGQCTFAKRWQALYSHWHQHKDEMWGSADFFAIATPHPSDNIGYLKSSKFNRWLLGYEFPRTVTVFGNKQIHFLCSKKKNVSLLEALKRRLAAKGSVDVDVVIHRKLKGNNGILKMDDVIHSMRMSNSEVHDAPIVGYIAKESHQGSLLKKWTDKLKNRGLQLSDVTDGLSDLLAMEDPDELTRQKIEETARRLAGRDSSADGYGTNLNILNELNVCCEPKLVLSEDNPIRLPFLYIHPPFGGQAGELEAHANGFRYSTSRHPKKGDELVDIMYANIEHAFFQPVDIMITVSLIHFNLHNHIMVGDKKTMYVQFSIERFRRIDTIEGEKRWNFDKDEIKERRKYEFDNIGRTGFQYFVSRVDGLWLQPQLKILNLKFERLLNKEDGFIGKIGPNKLSAFIIPTSSCLVELVFTPFLVIPLSSIEFVNLERVGLSGQTDFDVAIVFKDFKRDVMQIHSISYGYYGMILEWLDKTAVVYFESRVNLHWRAIIKTFTDDPQAFIDAGGWDFLNREKEIFIDSGGGFTELDLVQTEGYHPNYLNRDSEDYNSGQYGIFYNSYGGYITSIDYTESVPGCSVPKQRRLKKAVFGKLRVGPCFSAPKRRKINKAFGKRRRRAQCPKEA